MMQYGQVKIVFQAVDDSSYGDYIEKTVTWLTPLAEV